MSVMGSLRRQVYGIPPREMREAKNRFHAKERKHRGDVQRRALEILRRELARKEARHA